MVLHPAVLSNILIGRLKEGYQILDNGK